MYEYMTADKILKRMLGRVKSQFDRREGSIIYDATAPASIEMAELYIMADVILRQTFAATADRDFLQLRASEFNIYPEPATSAEVEGKFNIAVPIGARFSYNQYNFVVGEVINDKEHRYKLTCETTGRDPNSSMGTITPITAINGLTSAEIVSLITPGEDEEDTEVFRRRYFAALKSKAYGGNGADYKEKVLAIPGVGGVKVYRCWNGGGTVKLVILNSDFEPADTELIKEVQDVMDPEPNRGKGYGLAPIGHTVTTVSAEKVVINYEFTVVMKPGHEVSEIQKTAETRLKEKLLLRRKEWALQDEFQISTVRSSIALALLVDIDNVLDVTSVKLNGKQVSKIDLQTHQIPVIGTVRLVKG